MVEHHDEIVEAAGTAAIYWAGFCAEAARRGLTDTRGQAPAPGNARKTWQQARKVVAAARAAHAAKPQPRSNPSRFPKDWKPEAFRSPGEALALPPPAAGSLPPSPPPPLPVAPEPSPSTAPLSRFAKPEDPPEVKQMFAELEEDMRKQDRWMLKE
jgi:hypothetical protein